MYPLCILVICVRFHTLPRLWAEMAPKDDTYVYVLPD